MIELNQENIYPRKTINRTDKKTPCRILNVNQLYQFIIENIVIFDNGYIPLNNKKENIPET